jgi:hypothetical protein
MPQKQFIRIERRPGNIVLQVLGIFVGLLALMAAVIVGGFLLAALLGVGLIAWFVIYLRIWWLTRKTGRPGGQSDVVEAEYTVISTSERHDGDR